MFIDNWHCHSRSPSGRLRSRHRRNRSQSPCVQSGSERQSLDGAPPKASTQSLAHTLPQIKQILETGDDSPALQTQLANAGDVLDMNQCYGGLSDSSHGDDAHTVLMCAAIHGRESCVDMLLKWPKINVNVQNAKSRSTALHLAAENGHAEICASLLRGGAQRQLRNTDDNTAIMVAKQRRHSSVVDALAQHRASR